MPKHLILFVTFLLLLVALFYHPNPNPELVLESIEASKRYPEIKSVQNIPVANKALDFATMENTTTAESISAIINKQ